MRYSLQIINVVMIAPNIDIIFSNQNLQPILDTLVLRSTINFQPLASFDPLNPYLPVCLLHSDCVNQPVDRWMVAADGICEDIVPRFNTVVRSRKVCLKHELTTNVN